MAPPTMSTLRSAPTSKQLAQVMAATLAVAGCPVAVVWWLRTSGTISSPAVGVILGMALSLGASWIGRVLWERRPRSEDLLFSELMIWGFLHRRRTQRRLASALDMLAPMSGSDPDAPDALSVGERARLLEELVAAMETRDPYLHGHSRRVARHSWMIAQRMGLPREQVARIRTAAAIHDVGKTKTPKAILHKAGPLTDEEYAVIKCHPGDGADMVQVLHDPEMTAIVRHHHARLDGSGYPSSLAGEEIPLGARIIAVADTFDAITSARPYRAARAHRQAIEILRGEAGTKLDAAVVRAFCAHYAGRRPLAIWSSVAGLPERALSWLGGGVGSALSAAKVAAVAALVGGVTAGASTLGLASPGRHQAPGVTHATRDTRVAASLVSSQSVVTAVAPLASSVRRRAPHKHRGRSGRGAPAPPLGALAPHAQDKSIPGGDGIAGGGVSRGREEAPRGGGEAPPKGEGPPGKGGEEAHASEEVHGKEEARGKSEEAPGKVEETPGKSEEAHGKSEEGQSKAKAEEGAGGGKGEAGPGSAEQSSSAEGKGQGKAQRGA
jgi:hypothetical protein